MTINSSGFKKVHRKPSTDPRYRVLRSRQIRISRISRYAINSRSALVIRPPYPAGIILRRSRTAADEAPLRGSLADQLDVDFAFSGTVEFGEDDRLEPPERQLTVVEPHGDAPSQQGRAQVGVGVAALAVRIPGIVVTVPAALGHEPLHQPFEIVDQRRLELVDEERAGCVQRVDESDAAGHRGGLDDVPDLLGDVGDLGSLLT